MSTMQRKRTSHNQQKFLKNYRKIHQWKACKQSKKSKKKKRQIK